MLHDQSGQTEAGVGLRASAVWFAVILLLLWSPFRARSENKPSLHGRHWIAITGKPLGATAGARMFYKGGNAVDAACAMLAAGATMFDDVGWGGETQALIYDPVRKQVKGINALGVAPTGATPEFFQSRRMKHPPGEGPLAALTPGTPGGLMTMLAEFGTLSLREVLEPAREMAEGYPIEEESAAKIQNSIRKISRWPYSKRVFLPHAGGAFEGPRPGEIFRQPDLLKTLDKLVEEEAKALKEGRSRKEAIQAAYDRFYLGDIAEEFVRGSREQGGLHTREDLAGWKVQIEDPVKTTYKGIEVYKLNSWTQGPAMLQALNMLESLDVESMGLNSARYIHTLYQIFNLCLADRDFYFGDPYFPPVEPIEGLLSKAYARRRMLEIDWARNDPRVRPGDPYPFQGGTNPYKELLDGWSDRQVINEGETDQGRAVFDADFHAGTTSILAADKAGWVVAITPSGGWIPACIAGETGIAMSQRMQSFVLDEKDNPFNVVAPGKRPRVTLTPTLALKQDRPVLAMSVQGGDTQEQWQLQCFLNIVEFGMGVQEACEGPNFESKQARSSFGKHEIKPGDLTLNSEVPSWVRTKLLRMGYELSFRDKSSGPLTAIFFDWTNESLWGGASDDGDDMGIAW